MKHLTIQVIFLTLLGILSGMNVNAQRITVTIAGNGFPGNSGDGGPAKSAKLSYPTDVTRDAAGNIYFSDQNGTRIKKIAVRNGIISTIAGGGTSTADGIPATTASIGTSYMCSDAVGNIYFANANKIKKIDAVTNIITTVAGMGGTGYSGDGGPATLATFGNIVGVRLDNLGNIYAVDGANQRIRKITASTGIVNTIAGTGAMGYTGDGGPATAATLSSPIYLTLDPAGNLYFRDQGSAFRKINASTGVISTCSLYPSSPGVITSLYTVSGLCFSGGDLYFNEASCSCRKMNGSTDSVYWVGGNFGMESFADDTNSIYAYMNEEYGLCPDGSNNIYIADQYNHRIRKLINLTTTPTFAYGHGLSAKACIGVARPVDSLLWITDLDAGQTETWTVIVPPTKGTMSGFPATALSNGINTTVKPTGVFYNPSPGYSGTDSFTVRVTDGTTADTITLYFSMQPTPGAGTISGPGITCPGLNITLTETVSGGSWTTTNSHANVGYSGIVTGVTTGIDTIIYTYSDGCSVSTSTQVTINPLPVAGTISGSDTVCVGATTTLTETVPGGAWSTMDTYWATIGSGTGIVTGVTYGTATMTYTVSDAWCTNKATRSIFVNAPVQPISGTSTVCTGNTTSLYEGVPGGVWSLTNGNVILGTTGPTYAYITGVTLGLDTVVYTNTNSCGTGTVTKALTVNPAPSPGVISGPTAVCDGSGSITLTSTVPGGYWTSTHYYAMVGYTTGIVTGSMVGVDSIVYEVTGGAGCYGYAHILVTVDVAPVAGTITGPGTVCTSATITLTDASSGGTWSVSNPDASVSGTGIVTGITAGTDSVLYSVTNACGTASTTTVITINPAPDAGAITGPVTVCMGSAITLTDGATGGTWNASNSFASVSGGVVNGTAPGIDTITYSVTNSCGTAVVSYPVTITNCYALGLNTPGVPAIKIFPDPASSVLNVEWANLTSGSVTVIIADVTGKVVLKRELNGKTTGSGSGQLDVSGLTDGVYLVTMVSDANYFTRKLVITR